MKQKKVPVHYVDNKRFYEEIMAHKKKEQEAIEKGLETPRLNNYIGECIYKIAKNLSNKPCFMNYSFKEEMISDGIENCIMYFKDYDPAKTQNPFAYFTQIIFYAFLRRIGKEEKNRYTIYKNFQHIIVHGDLEFGRFGGRDLEDDVAYTPKMYDNINEFMDKFEKKEEIKKQKRKQMKEGLQKFYEE